MANSTLSSYSKHSVIIYNLVKRWEPISLNSIVFYPLYEHDLT